MKLLLWRCLALLALLVTVEASPVDAQSEYHWSDQFGNKSTLLNGTVIGGVSDLGAVFYNPGWLPRLQRPGFLLTAEAFELNQVEVHVGEGDRDEVEQSNLRGVPSLVAGMFSIPSLPGHTFAYSFLTRRRNHMDLFLDEQRRGDWLPASQGEESFLGSWGSVSKLDENWIGLSWAHEVSPRISVGLTTFGTYVGRTRRVELDMNLVGTAGEVSALSRLREYRYLSLGLRWKGGIAADLAPFRLGVSITSPGITALGSGSIRYEDFLTSSEQSEAGPNQTEIVVFREEDLGVDFHSPVSIGGGVTWVHPRAEVHLSGEWYSSVSRYEIMGVDSILAQSSGEYLDYGIVDQLKPVFNFGVGLEWLIGDAFSAYGSVARDASSAPKDPMFPFEFGEEVSNSVSQADGYYLGAGVSFEAAWIDLTAGFSYGSKEERRKNPFAIGDFSSGEPIADGTTIRLATRRWRFLLGFTIPMVEAISDGSSPNGP